MPNGQIGPNLWQWDGDPNGVDVDSLNVPKGGLVVVPSIPALFQKLSAFNDNSAYKTIYTTAGTVVSEGDSIIVTGASAPSGQANAIMNQAALLENAIGSIFYGYGVGGSRVADIVSRYTAGVYTKRPAAVMGRTWLFINIGCNDAFVGMAASTYKAALLGYVQQAITDGFEAGLIVLLTVMRRVDTPDALIGEYVQAQTEISVTTGCKLLDAHSLLPDPANATYFASTDGVHPTAAGNTILAARVNAILGGGDDTASVLAARDTEELSSYALAARAAFARGYVRLAADGTAAGRGVLSSASGAIGTGGFTAAAIIRPIGAGSGGGGLFCITGGVWLLLQNHITGTGLYPAIFDGTLKAPLAAQLIPWGKQSTVVFRKSNTGSLIDICVDGKFSETIADAITNISGGLSAIGSNGNSLDSPNIDIAAAVFINGYANNAAVVNLIRTGLMPQSAFSPEFWMPFIQGGTYTQNDISGNQRHVTFASPTVIQAAGSKYSAKISKSGTQGGVLWNTETNVTLAAVNFFSTNMVSGNTIVCRKAGIYDIRGYAAFAAFSSGFERCYVAIYVNSTLLARIEMSGAISVYPSATPTAIAQLAVGDVVTLRVFHLASDTTSQTVDAASLSVAEV